MFPLLHRSTRRRNFVLPLLVVVLVSVTYWRLQADLRARKQATESLTEAVETYIDHGVGQAGRWHIPESWLVSWIRDNNDTALLSNPNPTNVLEAAELALELAVRQGHFIEHTNIPLMVHQTYKNFDSSTWTRVIRNCVNSWVRAAATSEPLMAYFLWDDEGMQALLESRESAFASFFDLLPSNVEKTDAFRVLVLRWFGGVYADADTTILRHPMYWVPERDLTPWEDKSSGRQYAASAPSEGSFVAPSTASDHYQKILSHHDTSRNAISAIFGIESDNPPDTSTWWRMGYAYPIQLSNWAFAMAPQHPVTTAYIQQLQSEIETNRTRLDRCDPALLTGPGALTKVIMQYSQTADPELAFDALSGRFDAVGGRGKVVASDVMILPITGFSPGRGWIGNMGSQPVSHPNAKVFHTAAGSWKKSSLSVHYGKLCRTMFGMCRDWTNVS